MKRRVLLAIATGGLLVLAVPAPRVLACSPPFNPTIRALGPAQLVVVGTVGERVPGGRLFHVERSFNAIDPGTPIVIAFKEGEPVGDCSYPVSTGERKIIAPFREADGRLYADLGTLQADPGSDDGRRYLDEATALFGPGVVPEPIEPASDATAPGPLVLIGLSALVVAIAGVMVVAFRRP